ncbi:hypothetical protein [[Clostridium] colinum]|uniref:hypothetical protein n=1 Tax=[Clostridium] colinum TaxID=36835 RepID=UPI0020256775|nr:hypothetical protein [[Clostridium] colinum]
MSEKVKKFYKEQFLKSDEYKNKKDLVSALLKDNEIYSKNQVEEIIKKYLEVIL